MANCTVSGVFVDPQGNPIVGAALRFNTENAVTDASGNLISPIEIDTVTASDGTWSMALVQGISGILTADLTPVTGSPIVKYEFSLVIPATSTAVFAACWADAPNFSSAAAQFPLFFYNIAGQLTSAQLPNNPVITGSLSGDVSPATVISTGSTAATSLATRFGEVKNVKDFGALGDGNHDDASAIMAAIAAVPSTGGVVFFPPGIYSVKSQILITAISGPLAFLGSGFPVIQNNGSTAFDTVSISISGGATKPLLFDGLQFNGGTANGLYTYNVSNLVIQNCSFLSNVLSGIVLDMSFEPRITNCLFRLNEAYGIQLLRGAANNAVIHGCWIQSSTIGSIYLGADSACCTISGCDFEFSPIGIQMVGESGGTGPVTVKDSYFQNTTGGAVVFGVDSAHTIQCFNAYGNYFSGNFGTLQYVDTVNLINNYFADATFAVGTNVTNLISQGNSLTSGGSIYNPGNISAYVGVGSTATAGTQTVPISLQDINVVSGGGSTQTAIQWLDASGNLRANIIQQMNAAGNHGGSLIFQTSTAASAGNVLPGITIDDAQNTTFGSATATISAIIQGASTSGNGSNIQFRSGSSGFTSLMGPGNSILPTTSTDLTFYTNTGVGLSMYTNGGTQALNINTAQKVSLSGALAVGSITTAGLVKADASGNLTSLANGSNTNVLTISGGVPTWAAPASSGTVTTVSVASANGFAGTVANATTTPAITLSTSISGVLIGNGTSIAAASVTGTGAVVQASSPSIATATFTGTTTFPGTSTVDGSGNATFGGTVIGTGATHQLVCQASTNGANICTDFLNNGGSGFYNWRLGANLSANNTFQLFPSSTTNGTSFSTPVFQVGQTGIVTLGASSTTPQHLLNSATATPATGALTLLNGPSGVSGNPTGYLQITINGTQRVIPFW